MKKLTSGLLNKQIVQQGSGSIGRAVAFNISGPQFESSHHQNFIMNISTVNCWKDLNKEKEAGNVLFI